MGGETLNRDELECLLHGQPHSGAAPAGEDRTSVAGTSAPVPPSAPKHSTSGTDRPAAAELPASCLDRLHQLQRAFATEWSRALEQRLRGPVHVRLEECAVRSFGEYVLALERPTTFQVLRAHPLSHPLCLDIPLPIVFPMMDRLLGGGMRCDPIVRRPLTEIELRLLGRLTQWLISAMTAAWDECMALRLNVDSVDCNPRHVRCFAPSSRLVVCHFDVDLRMARGPMRMAFAADSIAQLEMLVQRQRRGKLGRSASDSSGRDRAMDDHAELAVVVAEMSWPMAQLDELQVGHIVQTDTPAAAQVQVRVDDETVYLARPGQYHGKRAFRIEQRVLDESG